MSRLTLSVLASLLLYAELRGADSAPDAADKIGERWAAAEFGVAGKFKINRAWPIRYGLADDARQQTEGWQLAAGQAVYAAKCAGCHADDGSGQGPQAKAKKLSPAPRDFRRGIFKFHENALGGWSRKPSRHDLAETLRLGLPGTAMPAFDKLSAEQRDAVIEYVRWLTMRGEFAYLFARQLRGDFDIPSEATEDDLIEYASITRENVQTLWRPDEASGDRLPVSDPPPMTDESIARGKKHYEGNFYACHKCHANDGRGVKFDGDAFVMRDQWGHPQAMPDLTKGVFTGGDGQYDLYTRIRGGIPGSPHPAMEALSVRDGHDRALWELVHYVYHLASQKPDAAAHARRRPPEEDEWEETTDESAAEDEDNAPLVAQGWGKITGRILYGGRNVPDRKMLPIVGVDAKLLKEQKILDPSLIVNAENFGLANVVVWIDQKQAEGLLPIHESQREPPAKEATLVSRDLQNQPHVLVVRVGQPLVIRNENAVAENFRLAPERNPSFNMVAPAGRDLLYQFKSEERLPFPVTSSVHPWVQCFVVAASHPYVAVTDEHGAFAFEHVPAGTWQIRLWHEAIGTIATGTVERGAFSSQDSKRFATIAADEANAGEIVLDAKLFGH